MSNRQNEEERLSHSPVCLTNGSRTHGMDGHLAGWLRTETDSRMRARERRRSYFRSLSRLLMEVALVVR